MKQIPNFPDYYITKDGRVYSRKSRKYLKPDTTRIGYCQDILYKAGKRNHRLIHRLILETYVGPCPNNMEGCHNNGIKTDNRLSNLRWDTHSANQKDSVKHGTAVFGGKGENHLRAKLNGLQVRVIKRLLAEDTMIQIEIAKVFSVTSMTISNIKTGRCWSDNNMY